MRAVLLAGGKGARLLPVTQEVPKPLVPLCNVPLIEIMIRQLRRHGVNHVTVAIGHRSEQIQARLGGGERFGIEIEYLLEETPLDTAGCLGLLEPPTAPFLVANADLLTTLNFSKMMEFHHAHGFLATVGAHVRSISLDFGVLEVGEEGRLLAYKEKPTCNYLVSMGIYCFGPEVCKLIQPGERLSMPALLLRLVAAGEEVRCYQEDCYWLDVGRPEEYARAIEDFRRNPARFLPEAAGSGE